MLVAVHYLCKKHSYVLLEPNKFTTYVDLMLFVMSNFTVLHCYNICCVS